MDSITFCSSWKLPWYLKQRSSTKRGWHICIQEANQFFSSSVHDLFHIILSTTCFCGDFSPISYIWFTHVDLTDNNIWGATNQSDFNMAFWTVWSMWTFDMCLCSCVDSAFNYYVPRSASLAFFESLLMDLCFVLHCNLISGITQIPARCYLLYLEAKLWLRLQAHAWSDGSGFPASSCICPLNDVHVSISPRLTHIRVIGKCEPFKIVCSKCGVIGEWENMCPRICRSNFQAALFISFIPCGLIELSVLHRSPCPGKSGMPLSCKNFCSGRRWCRVTCFCCRGDMCSKHTVTVITRLHQQAYRPSVQFLSPP